MPLERPIENVWDYPRPPSIELSDERIVVVMEGRVIAETTRSYRVCETSHPPTYYLPLRAFADDVLWAVSGTTMCEWKGVASYFDIVTENRTIAAGAWTYPRPNARFKDLVDHVAIYPGKVDLEDLGSLRERHAFDLGTAKGNHLP